MFFKNRPTMNIRPHVLPALLIFIFSITVLADEPTIDYPLLEVEDGDTLLLEIAGEPVRVQLLGIDAPEDAENPKFKLDLEKTEMQPGQLKQLGAAATGHLQSLVTVGEMVTIQGDIREKDRYGRVPAIVSNTDGRALPDAMVQDGYAIALEPTEQDYAYGRRLDRLERFSRKSNNGLWGTHPEEFRNWYDRTR